MIITVPHAVITPQTRGVLRSEKFQMVESVPRVPYRIGARSVLVTPEDAAQLEFDMTKCGNVFLACDADGFASRINPADVQIKPGEHAR